LSEPQRREEKRRQLKEEEDRTLLAERERLREEIGRKLKDHLNRP
jgi:hypothetical protein